LRGEKLTEYEEVPAWQAINCEGGIWEQRKHAEEKLGGGRLDLINPEAFPSLEEALSRDHQGERSQKK